MYYVIFRDLGTILLGFLIPILKSLRISRFSLKTTVEKSLALQK